MIGLCIFILHSAYYCSHSVFSAVVFLFSLCVSLFSLRFFLRASRSPAVHREFDVYDWALLFALTLGHQVPTGRAERPSTTKNGCEALIFIRLWLHVQQKISIKNIRNLMFWDIGFKQSSKTVCF